MRYAEFRPAEALAPLVRCFWTLRAERADSGAAPEPALPDGSTELIFNLADPFVDASAVTGPVLQPRVVFVGQITQPIVVAPTGRVDLVAVRFRPHGAAPFFGPVAELTDRWAAVDQLGAPVLAQLGDRLAEESDPGRRIDLLEGTLIRLAGGLRRPDPRVAAAVRAIDLSGGRASIGELVGDLGIGRRQLERRFEADVGLSPKVLAGIVRFQRALRALRGGAPSWAAVATASGYYDQSHFVRDFRRFAGRPPSVFLRHESAFTSLFLDPPA
jgi:AraC-like DNA-binding protein